MTALIDRNLDRAEVEQTITAPERAVLDPSQRVILMRRYVDAQLRRQMLLCVVVEETPEERVVITAYKTSQIAKYLNRTMP